MLNIAIIGFGDHIKKNIIPALLRLKYLNIEGVYVRDVIKANEELAVLPYQLTIKNLDEKLNVDVNWVYIGTSIDSHYEFVNKYLLEKKNVICEKSLTESYDKALSLFSLAEKVDKKLIEVCMYKYHKQFTHLSNMLSSNSVGIKTVEAEFTIPKLAPNNIRYSKERCGGALLDVGYYPISIFIELFGVPSDIKYNLYEESGIEVETSGVVIFDYGHFYCIAKWGIGDVYQNKIVYSLGDTNYTYNRIFSKPMTLNTNVIINDGYNLNTIEIGSDDQFLNFFEAAFNSKIDENYKHNTLSTLQILSNIYTGYYNK